MGIDMFLEQSESQAAAVESLSDLQVMTYQELQTAISDFANDEDSLQGKTYDSARDFFKAVLLPLAQGAELYAATLTTCLVKLPSEYQSQVDSKSWQKDDLRQKIETERFLIAQLDEMRQSLSRLTLPNTLKDSLLCSNTDLSRGHAANLQTYEKILEDLLAYDGISMTLFTELEEIKVQLDTGFAQLGQTWDTTSATFSLPKNMSWAAELSSRYAVKDIEATTQEKGFMVTLMSQYGFDQETVEAMLNVKRGIDDKFQKLSQEERDYLLLRLFGEVNYNTFYWQETAGYLTPYFFKEVISNPTTGEIQKIPKPLLEIFQELGLSEDQAKKLNYNLRLQHEMAGGGYGNISVIKESDQRNKTNQYELYRNSFEEIFGSKQSFDDFWDTKLKKYSNNGIGNADFTHQSITMATYLNPTSFQLADFFGGRNNVKDLSGWEGDTTSNANDMAPSIGEDDYKADLDSVNIVGRMANNGQPYMEALISYYGDIRDNFNVPVREKEFLKNKDWTEVKGTIYSSLVPQTILRSGEERARAYIAEHYNDVSSFLERLEDVANE